MSFYLQIDDPDRIATGVSSETDQAPQLVVWGTNVVVSQCKEKFKKFVLRFVDPNPEEDEISDDLNLNEPLYLQKLQEVCRHPEIYLYYTK